VPLEKNEIFNRIADALGTSSVKEIAEKYGISEPAVYNWQKGSVPKVEILADIADSTSTSIHWLLTGQGEKKIRKPLTRIADSVFEKVDRHVTWDEEPPGRQVIFNSTAENVIDELAKTQGKSFDRVIYDLVIESLEAKGLINTTPFESVKFIRADIEWVQIKLLGYISCGDPIEAIPNEDQILVAKTFPGDPRFMFVLIARGDSMMDMDIRDGDRIICRTDLTPKSGDAVIALVNGDSATCKRFYPRGSEIALVPANPDYKTRTYPADEVVIQGVVEEIQRRARG
jgi:SOS-response transcriptional repressor LexA